MRTVASAPVVAGDRNPRFRDLVAGEWLKLRAQRSFYVLTGMGLALVLLAAPVSGRHLRLTPSGRATYDPLVMAFGTGVWGTLMFGACCFGAMAVAGEFASGLIHVTLVAVPNRRRVVLAKAAAVTAVTAGFGVVAAPLAFGATAVTLTHAQVSVSPAYPGVWRAIVASALVLPVCGLIGMVIGALARHVGSTVIAVVMTQVLPAALIRPHGDQGWWAHASALIPEHAWQALAGGSDTGAVYLPGATTAWLVLVAWAVASLVGAIIQVSRRDT